MKIAILGTVGVPANYGGFETLAENLVKYHAATSMVDELTVYSSGKAYPDKPPTFFSTRLKYIPLNANGAQSVPYDIWSLFSAVWNRNEVILMLGVSGAIALPLVRLVSSARVVTNIDGIEWRREKWQWLAKWFLKYSEKIAVRYSDVVIADNAAIADYVRAAYDVESKVIAYGGDHALSVSEVQFDEFTLPESYAFSVCRIEPENNVHLIVEAFSRQEAIPLVMVGNWNNSEYGRKIKMRYVGTENLLLLDPIYDLGKLKTLRSKATLYLHGHSAGGTNPSLVEAMHFAKPILAFDCDFNRATTEGKALYFSTVEELLALVSHPDRDRLDQVGRDMQEIAQRCYTWDKIARQYFELLT